MQRLIARLDIKNGIVIKGINLEGQRPVGNPVELAHKYYSQSVDEILFMDSVASLYGRSNLFQLIADACKSVFVPITMGGGIRNIADVEHALAAGADKVSVNTGLLTNPDFADQITSIYGSQILVGSIEAKRNGAAWEAYHSNGRESSGRDVFDWAKELAQRGVGELLVTSVDKEGTQRGFDLDLYDALEAAVHIPIVACGGAGTLAHLNKLGEKTHLQGVAIASLLHYNKATVAQIKSALPFSIDRSPRFR
jgi:cyclase